jgi:hypothetical protein
VATFHWEALALSRGARGSQGGDPAGTTRGGTQKVKSSHFKVNDVNGTIFVLFCLFTVAVSHNILTFIDMWYFYIMTIRRPLGRRSCYSLDYQE